ncbi:MAG TPA: histone deacetylase, partial [Vicinamibacterales bacterium]|nr:histone deacetylase [Vicinamibacterales bacterium]
LSLGMERVAVVDYDVHHGNGTQWIFYEDPRVLYVSTHQYPFYPGTGAADETGSGAGRGFTVNVPLEAGTTDAEYARVYDTRVLPALEAFKPEALLVSAGYDAHVQDPLAGMRMTTEGYAYLVKRLDAAAAEWCQGRLALITEGGYHAGALRACLEATIDVIS